MSMQATWSAMAPAIGNHLWQSTALAVAAGLITLALRENHARVRYGLWLAASVKFLLPFALLLSIGAHLPHRNTPSITPSEPLVGSSVQSLGQSFVPFTPMPVVDRPLPHPPQEKMKPQFSWKNYMPLLLVDLWLAGVLSLAAIWGRRWYAMHAMLRGASVLNEGREHDVLMRVMHATGVRQRVRIVTAQTALEPGVFGMFRPKLLWPEGISQKLSDDQIEAVLLHEICHVQRRDNLTAALHMVVQTLFWFHPLVWWMGNRMVEERERACDEAVLRLCAQPQVYAESILKVCAFCVESPLPCVSGVTGADLKKRMVQIMNEGLVRKLDFSRKMLLLAAASVAVATPFTIGMLMPALGHAQAAAQSIAGTWQGTLHGPKASADDKGIRIVLEITKTPTGYSAVNYSIDQGGQPIPVKSVTLEGSTLKLGIPAVGGSYEGKVTADGNNITGNWTQGIPVPLNFARATKETAWTIPTPAPPVPPMDAKVSPAFDVATIKPTKPDTKGKGFGVNGRNVRTLNTSLEDLMTFTYGVHIKQIVGGPDWAESDHFDIAGTPDQPGTPNRDQLKAMFEKLLAERFKLKFHHEKRELSVFALTVAKSGTKIDKAESTQLPRLNIRPEPGGVAIVISHGTMLDTTHILQEVVLDRPVVDQTNLAGTFDFVFKWAPDDAQFQGKGNPFLEMMKDQPAPAAPLPNLFTALQEQVGLKLDPVKTMVDVMVIDHVEKPSEN